MAAFLWKGQHLWDKCSFCIFLGSTMYIVFSILVSAITFISSICFFVELGHRELTNNFCCISSCKLGSNQDILLWIFFLFFRSHSLLLFQVVSGVGFIRSELSTFCWKIFSILRLNLFPSLVLHTWNHFEVDRSQN